MRSVSPETREKIALEVAKHAARSVTFGVIEDRAKGRGQVSDSLRTVDNNKILY